MKEETFIIVDVSLISVLLCTYSFVLVFAIRNSYKYLYKMKKWNQFYLTSFYALTIMIAVNRLIDRSLRIDQDLGGGFTHAT